MLAVSSSNHSDLIPENYKTMFYDKEIIRLYEDNMGTDLKLSDSSKHNVDYLIMKIKLEQTYASPKVVENILSKTWYMDVEDDQVSLTPSVSSIDNWCRFGDDVICAMVTFAEGTYVEKYFLKCFPVLYSLYPGNDLNSPENILHQLPKSMFCETVQAEASEFNHTFGSTAMFPNFYTNKRNVIFSGSYVITNEARSVARVCLDDTDFIRTTMVSSGSIPTTWLFVYAHGIFLYPYILDMNALLSSLT